MKPVANHPHEGKTRTRVGPASLLLLLLAALAPALVEASLPRAGASLLEHEEVAASRLDSSRQAAPFRSPAIAPVAPATIGNGFTLFAGDELARASRAPGAPALAPDHAGDLALASREREERFALHQGADAFGLEPLRGPPPLSEDLCQGDDECLAGTRIGGLELSGPFFTEGQPRLSLELQWACSVSRCGLADGKPLDPWGLESGGAFGAIDRRDRGVSAVPPSYTAQEKAAATQRALGCLAFGGGAAWTAFSGGALGGVLGGFALMSSGGAACFGKESPIGMVVRETADAAAKSQGVQMTAAVAQQQAANNAAVEGAITTGLMGFGAIAPGAPAIGVRTDGPPAAVTGRPSPAPADSPYVTRYDSRFRGRPDPEWSIDTRAFTTGEPTAAGGIRNRTEFWTEWLRRHPETISKGNRFLIEKKGLSPRVDDHWISYFPEHAPHARETLFHHHVDQGPYAVPVPSSTHPGSGGPFHAP